MGQVAELLLIVTNNFVLLPPLKKSARLTENFFLLDTSLID
jgi:hypothetical protein